MLFQNIDVPGLAGGLIVFTSYVRIEIVLPCLRVTFCCIISERSCYTCADMRLHPHISFAQYIAVYIWGIWQTNSSTTNKTRMHAKAWCIYSDRAYTQSEVHTHCYSVLIHLLELGHTGTSPSSWCNYPPLAPDRWWWGGGQCVLGWWMVLLSLPQSQWPIAQQTHSPHHHTDTWGWCCQFYTHKGQLGGSEWGLLNLR